MDVVGSMVGGPIAEALRLFFLAFYAIGVTVLVLRVLPLAFRSAPVERRAEGIYRYLPFFLLPVGFLNPSGRHAHTRR